MEEHTEVVEVETSCPVCGHRLDKGEIVRGEMGDPSPGDITVCAHCAGVGFYLEGGELRAATVMDMAALDQQTFANLQIVRWKILKAKRDKERGIEG